MMGLQIVPIQLHSWQFILIVQKLKIPTSEMNGWAANREKVTLRHDDPKLRMHLANGGNYGVTTDQNRFVVAADTKEVEQAVEQRLPKTFSVLSPRHKTKHFYFYGTISKPILCKPTAQGDPCADIKYGNAYVLGSGSVFENYGCYQIADDLPIATITEDQLLAALDEFIQPEQHPINEPSEVSQSQGDPELNFPIAQIVPNLGALTSNGSDLSGPHPVHGSTTGSNFHVDTEKNVWHCFRAGHDSGGGPLELLAVLNGIIRCEDCHRGALRGEKFWEAIQKAQELGLVSKTYLATNAEGKDGGKPEKPNIAPLLRKLQSQFVFKTTKDIEEIFCYEDGVYVPAEHKIKGLLEAWLGAKATIHIVNEILDHIRRSSYVDRSEFNRYKGFLPVENGLLELKTLKLHPYDKNQIFTFKLSVTFDPSKKCPKWLKFLSEILLPEEQPTLQEWMGYCIFPGMPKHKMMWFYGTGRNGKGRVIATLEFIVGQENCCYLELREFDGEHRFALSQLYGKLINVSSEPTTKKELETPLLKKITGEDSLDAEVKNKQRRLKFKNIAKVTVLGNNFPQVKDTSVGFWDRVLIIKFPYEFRGLNQKDDIEKTWLDDPDEVSGIFNWMLEGLHRLGTTGDFTYSKSTLETMVEFKRVSDPIAAWIEDKCVYGLDYYVIKKQAYESYKQYADEMGIAPESDRKFYMRLRNAPRIKEVETKLQGKSERIWKGITLNDKPTEISSPDTAQATLIPTNTTDTADNAHTIPSEKNGRGFLEIRESMEGAVTASSALNGDSQESKSKKILVINPSDGRRCEGTDKNAEQCGFASNEVLNDPDGVEPAYFCKAHMDSVLAAYDPRSVEVRHGNLSQGRDQA